MSASKWAIVVMTLLSACSPSKLSGRRLAGSKAPTFAALVFSKTAGFRHDSIPDGIAAIQDLGAANGFSVDATEDPSLFTDKNLANYQVVIFLSTTGTILDDAQKAAFQRYIENGNGFVGIHSATDTEYDWQWYGQLVGAYFSDHPAIQQATIQIEDPNHPSTAPPLPLLWPRTDEWYNFRTNPRGSVHVLATMDESTYSGGTMGDHPIAWCHDFDGGKSWYTAPGHTRESYYEDLFRQHLLGGIMTVAGAATADCSVSP